jgi:hypothetical protein
LLLLLFASKRKTLEWVRGCFSSVVVATQPQQLSPPLEGRATSGRD